ncbi:FecR family protein [Abyssalbus ytuae]|uniref:FecR family protein n=1 Tax=Abyssalbus ytuae TaxID=2926907 RepID=A0A9E7CSK7_9FLAO|nr:FecR family protein [Abyssalbus ytuae]UOB16436.1 FecR family protein [Abyssalbus ytuae]
MKRENLLAKWLSGDITPEELEALKKLEDLEVYEKIVKKTSQFKVPAYNKEEELKNVINKLNRTEPKVKKLIPWKAISGIAAAFVILIGSYFYLNSFSDTIISTQYAEKKTMQLPDNSEVTLNVGSEISFNKKHWEQKREVKLGGEAFFKVEKGEKFDVITTAGTISVVGTQFNVKNRKDFFEVLCYEGAVKVTYQNTEKILKRGDAFQVIKGKITQVLPFSNSKPRWMANQSLFTKIPYGLVLDEYQRTFNVKIETKNVDINYHFTGEFSHSDKELALKTITRPLNLKYKWVTFSKVIIYAGDSN